MRLWARAGHSTTNQEQDTPGYEEHVLAVHLAALRDADTYILDMVLRGFASAWRKSLGKTYIEIVVLGDTCTGILWAVQTR